MCGIAGTVGGARPDPGVLARMAGAMAHRGPDGQGTWHDDACGLAFRRLAIIDLDPRSDQPLHHGPWHLAFNGEIYNYRELREELRALGHAFATEGDGEVLLRAWAQWEEGALERIDGMFAFAVWHDQRRALTLVADPFGEKPLFWAQDGERLVFGSDVRAIAQAAPGVARPAESAFAPYLALGRQPPLGETFFAGVRRLPGAHLLRVHDGRSEVVRYWTPRPVEVPADYPEAVEALRAALMGSITRRLRSDVPVGTSLSGGVDSSAIVCLAAQLAGDHRRHAFTARFPGFERDEWSHAELSAQAAGVVEHHAVEPTAAQLLGDLDALVRDQEEPFGSLSAYAQWRVNAAAREAGVTVLLDGQGADELFGGYAGVAGWALASMGPRAAVRALRDPHLARRTPPVPPGAAGSSPLRRELLRQAFHTSLPELLRYADRDSMAHSREVRLPFLCREVAELGLSMPPQFLWRGGVQKAVLRDAVRGLVPGAVLDRRDKVGFEPPQDRWLADPAVVARMREVLLDRAARGRGLYDVAALEADAAAGRWRDPRGAWRAFNLELWLHALERDPAWRAAPAAGAPALAGEGAGP